MALSFNDNRIVAIPIYLKIVWYSKPQTMAQCIKWDYRFGENFYYLCTWGTNCVKGRINTFLSVIWLPPRLTLTQLFLFRPKVTGSLVTKLGRKKSQGCHWDSNGQPSDSRQCFTVLLYLNKGVTMVYHYALSVNWE